MVHNFILPTTSRQRMSAEGIEFVDAAPQEAELVLAAESAAPHGEPCAACGAPLDARDKFCPACGAPNEKAALPPAPAAEPQRHFRCQSCGAEVATDPDQRSFVCPFCDSTVVVEYAPEATGRQPPEFVIGFAVTPEQAREKFSQWIAGNSWFRPGDLKTASVAEKQRGVYLPFWSFSMLARSEWNASIGEYWWRTETYTTTDSKGRLVTRTRTVRETEWWPLAGRFHSYKSGYLVSGSRGLPQADADSIKPFHLPALKRYEPYYLAGWLAEEYSVAREEALQRSQAEFHRRQEREIAAFLPGDTHSHLNVATRFSRINSDLCLLPVFVLSYRYREKLYRFLVNGQTGKCAGTKPWSGMRIGLAIGAAVLVVAAIIAAIAVISLLSGA